MIDPWLPLLEKLPLIRTEKAVVARYKADPLGRTFLPVADILRAHNRIDESLELLSQGVERHPTFTVARVVLARELYRKGMVYESWQILEDSPVSLAENVLAQKLRFKLGILLGNPPLVREVLSHMQLHKMLDNETRKLADLYEVSGMTAAHTQLMDELRVKGVEVVLTERQAATQKASLPPPPKAVVQDIEQASQERLKTHAEGFHVVSLGDIFRPQNEASFNAGPSIGDAVELDSTTLAEIYFGQKHYTKALAVYKRLLRINPTNDYLKKKVSDLIRLEREQKDHDTEVDPAMVDQMEQVQIIDTQIHYLNRLLDRLP